MVDLRVEDPATIEAFLAALAAEDVKLPLTLHESETGSVVDATGREIFVVDVHNDRPDRQVENIARWIILAVNTCGGFMVVRHG